MGVSENRGTPKSSILIGISIINHPFWGTIIFGNTHIPCNQVVVSSPEISEKTIRREDWLLWLAAIRIGCDKSLQLQRELQLRPMAAAPERGSW